MKKLNDYVKRECANWVIDRCHGKKDGECSIFKNKRCAYFERFLLINGIVQEYKDRCYN